MIDINIKPTHPNFRMPEEKSDGAVGYDLFMPEHGVCGQYYPQEKTSLGFAMEYPVGYAVFIIPRSSVGFIHKLEINNTIGLIDPDYRGTLFARFRTKDGKAFEWEAGDRLLQMLLVPIPKTRLVKVDSLSDTLRGEGGIGSTGK